MNVMKIAKYVGIGSAAYCALSFVSYFALLKRANLTIEEFNYMWRIMGYKKAVKIALFRSINKEN